MSKFTNLKEFTDKEFEDVLEGIDGLGLNELIEDRLLNCPERYLI
jgi:hypothetical protein